MKIVSDMSERYSAVDAVKALPHYSKDGEVINECCMSILESEPLQHVNTIYGLNITHI